jgi:hypothetical protein
LAGHVSLENASDASASCGWASQFVRQPRQSGKEFELKVLRSEVFAARNDARRLSAPYAPGAPVGGSFCFVCATADITPMPINISAPTMIQVCGT